MKSTEEVLEILKEYKRTQGAKYGIEQIALVGSTARGEHCEGSDIDIYLKLAHTTFRSYMAIKDDLEQAFDGKVDLITMHSNMRQHFRNNLNRDAIFL